MKPWVTEVHGTPAFRLPVYPQRVGGQIKVFTPPPRNSSPPSMSIPETMQAGRCYTSTRFWFCGSGEVVESHLERCCCEGGCLQAANSPRGKVPRWQANCHPRCHAAPGKHCSNGTQECSFSCCFYEPLNRAKMKYSTNFQVCVKSAAGALLMFVKCF